MEQIQVEVECWGDETSYVKTWRIAVWNLSKSVIWSLDSKLSNIFVVIYWVAGEPAKAEAQEQKMRKKKFINMC